MAQGIDGTKRCKRRHGGDGAHAPKRSGNLFRAVLIAVGKGGVAVGKGGSAVGKGGGGTISIVIDSTGLFDDITSPGSAQGDGKAHDEARRPVANAGQAACHDTQPDESVEEPHIPVHALRKATSSPFDDDAIERQNAPHIGRSPNGCPYCIDEDDSGKHVPIIALSIEQAIGYALQEVEKSRCHRRIEDDEDGAFGAYFSDNRARDEVCNDKQKGIEKRRPRDP